MAVTLLLLTLAVASITHTWMTGSIFAPIHRRISAWEQRREWWIRIPARGAHCHFCIAHWIAVALGVGLYLQPDVMPLVLLVASSIILSQVALVGFSQLVRLQQQPRRVA